MNTISELDNRWNKLALEESATQRDPLSRRPRVTEGSIMPDRTALRLVVYETDNRLFSWRLETAQGNHGVVVTSGWVYRSAVSALGAGRRFVHLYMYDDAPVTIPAEYG